MHYTQALYQAMERVKTSLETEQEKLATLVKNLSADPSKETAAEQKSEPVSEEWLQSLKERRKVRTVWIITVSHRPKSDPISDMADHLARLSDIVAV